MVETNYARELGKAYGRIRQLDVRLSEAMDVLRELYAALNEQEVTGAERIERAAIEAAALISKTDAVHAWRNDWRSDEP